MGPTIDDVIVVATTCVNVSPEDRRELIRSITSIRDNPECESRSSQDVHVSRQEKSLVTMRACLASKLWMDAHNKDRVYTYYGYRDMTFEQMMHLITKVYFPHLGKLTMSKTNMLSPIEQCLFTKMWLWKCGGRKGNKEIADQWSIDQRMVSRIINRWAPLWEEVGHRYSRCMVDENFFMSSQPPGFANRYLYS